MLLLAIPEDVMLLITGLGLLQAVLLAIMIYFHPRSDRSVNKFLALYILSFSLVMAGPFILKIVTWQKAYFLGSLPLLVGPLMLFYIRSFKEKITWRKAWPHLVMFVVFSVFLTWRIMLKASEFPASEEVPPEMVTGIVPLVIFMVRYGQLATYYFLARRQLTSYHRSINLLFSNTTGINMKWGWWLINGYLAIIIISTLLYFLMRIYPEQFNLIYAMMIAISTPYIYITSFKGMMQPTIWQLKKDETNEELEEEIVESETVTKSKVSKNVMPDERLDQIIKKINVAMREHKLYQEAELTLHQLSVHLDFPSHQVSQAINEGMKQSFYDLVNGYRVEEAKRLLRDPENRSFTILSVGFEAGFNSKTTFNTVFKKFTGQTPTYFREHQQEMSIA